MRRAGSAASSTAEPITEPRFSSSASACPRKSVPHSLFEPALFVREGAPRDEQGHGHERRAQVRNEQVLEDFASAASARTEREVQAIFQAFALGAVSLLR